MTETTPTVETAICFDLDGTLVSYRRPYEDVVRETLGTEYEDVTDEMVGATLEAFGAAFEAMEEAPYRVAVAAGCEVGDETRTEAVTEEIVKELVDRLRRTEFEATTVPDPARSCVETLAADESVAVCVVTDGLPAWQREKLAHHGLAEHVTEVVTSYGVGGHKESGRPYEALREAIAAEEYVMIGDDYAGDVEAARAAGFVPIHYEADDGPDFFGTLDALL